MSGDVITDMFPELSAVLLQILSWLVGAGLLTGVAVWWWQRRSASQDAASQGPPLLTVSVPDHEVEPRARRFLRIGLGLLWLVDGLLQAQPAMPAGFVAHIFARGITTSPGWLVEVIQPSAQAWANHPVAADAVTVSIELGLGLLLLLGGRGLLARSALWASLAFSAVVWMGGEFFGGLLAPAASWLTGAPGAILVYALAAALLLVRWDRWSSGEARKLARRAGGIWMLAAATLQALPWEGNWSGHGLSTAFEVGTHNSQPTVCLLYTSPSPRD